MCHLQVMELIAVLYCEAVDYVFASAVCMHDKNRELSYIMLKYFSKGMSLQTTRSTNFRCVMKSTPVAYIWICGPLSSKAALCVALCPSVLCHQFVKTGKLKFSETITFVMSNWWAILWLKVKGQGHWERKCKNCLSSTSSRNKNAQLSLTNPRDAKACQNCPSSTYKTSIADKLATCLKNGNPVFSN